MALFVPSTKGLEVQASFTHLLVVPNTYDFISLKNTKGYVMKNIQASVFHTLK